jgi:D-arabinono-1,4-lactone oxidase
MTSRPRTGVEPPERDADGFYHPASEEQLTALVVMASRDGCQCRVRGAAHSVAHAIYADPLQAIPNRVNQQTPPSRDQVDVMLDLHRGLRVIDPYEKIVEADAGIHLGADPNDPTGTADVATSLLAQLWEKGWTLSNLGGITRQTVSGFTATGSSGGSVQHSLNEDILGFRVIDARGKIHELSRDDKNPAMFNAMSPNLGLLGVVSAIRFKCVDAYNISGQEAVTTVDDCAIDLFGPGTHERPSLEQFLRGAEYARLVWWPQRGAERVQVWQAQRISPQPGFKPHSYEEFTAQAQISEVMISLLYTILGNLDDLNQARPQLAKICERIDRDVDELPMLRGLGPAGKLLAQFIGICVSVGTDAGLTILKPCAPMIRRNLATIFPWLLALFVRLDSEKPGDEQGEPQSFRDYAWTGLPMDNEVNDALLPTSFTEIWLPLPRVEQVMQLLHTFFSEPHCDQASYARTGLYGWELYAAKATSFSMSASHSDGTDEWKDGVFRIDPYWFAANPGDPTKTFYPQLWGLLREHKIPFRLHWGKYQPSEELSCWAEFLKSQYPKWDEFLSLRKRRDPNGIFLTSYWRERFEL